MQCNDKPKVLKFLSFYFYITVSDEILIGILIYHKTQRAFDVFKYVWARLDLTYIKEGSTTSMTSKAQRVYAIKFLFDDKLTIRTELYGQEIIYIIKFEFV